MSIYEIGQFFGPETDDSQVVDRAFARLNDRENFSDEQLLMAIYCIDTYGSVADHETLAKLLEAQPLKEEVLEYRMAA